MPKTTFDKENITSDLDTLKSLIDERAKLVEDARAEKSSFNEAIDKTIRENEDELKVLRIKASEILGIPSRLTTPEGKTPRSTEENPSPEEVGKDKVEKP